MSRKKSIGEARERARQAAVHLKPAAGKVKPLARSTGAAAKRRVHRTRAWAAPRVERAGQVLQDSVAPKASAALSSAARRLDPGKPRRRPWRMLAGLAAVAAAAGAAAACIRNRRKPDSTTSAAKESEVASAAETGDGQAGTGIDTDARGPIRAAGQTP
jgi:hypothetical protein